jgi:hypothetical protein
LKKLVVLMLKRESHLYLAHDVVVKAHVGRSRVGETVGAGQIQHINEVLKWGVKQVLLAWVWVLEELMSVPGYKRTLVHSAEGLNMLVLQKRRQATIFARETVCTMKVRSCILLSLLSTGMHWIWSSSCSQATLSPEPEARGGG